MPAKRELTMRQLRQMLRLARDGVSAREIGRTLGVARSTVQDNLKRAAAAGLAWPLPAELTDDVLEQRLFARAGVKQGFRRRSSRTGLRWSRELKRPGVNLMVLWEEYRDEPSRTATATAASAICSASSSGGCRRCMRQHHVAGDKVFVDYSGKKIADRRSAHRRGARGRDLRRRARRLELHLRRGDLDPDAAGLDRRACAHVPLLRRRAAPGRARQSEERGPQGLVLRSRDQPQLRHDGRALRRRRPAGPTAQAARTRPRSRPGSASPRPTSSAGCGGRPSSRSPRPTPRSRLRSSASTPTSCAVSASAGATCSRASSGRPCDRCRATTTSSPNGGSPASASTITSRSRASSTRCRTP